MTDAAVLAHKALYQAGNKRQECVSIGAAMLLGRIAIFKGDGGEFSDILHERIPRHARENPLKSNRMEADLADAYLLQTIDRQEDMAEWIRKGDISEKRLFAMSIPFARILLGKYLIQSGKSEIWLSMENDALALAETLRCRMAIIYGYILTAAACRAQGKTPEAAAAMKTALDAALPDRLYMPFAENRSPLGPLLDEHCPETALNGILALADKHEAGKAEILRRLYPSPSFELTSRERDVALLAKDGLKAGEIAPRLNISEHTVKTVLKKIHSKLGIHSKEELKWKDF
jgi:LuxR family maltose regulon positive regulatory protein